MIQPRVSFLQRLFRRDPGPPTAEQLYNDDARAALTADLAKSSAAQLNARIDSARAAGKWTDEMEAIWRQLSGPAERFTAGDAERLDDLKRLLTESGE